MQALPAHHTIESITIPTGFLAGTHLAFSAALNCIIGGRGSGKTTLLELLRFALGTPVAPSRAADHDAFVKANLGTGRVVVRIRTQHGVRYECSRAYGEAARVTTETGELADVSLDSDLFRVEQFSQNEIETIAMSPTAQLALVDRFVAADARRVAEAIAELERRLTQNGSSLLSLTAEIENDEDRARELPSVEEALKGVQHVSGPDAAEAQRAYAHRALRGRERAALAHAEQQLQALRSGLGAFAVDVQRRLTGATDAEVARGPNRDVFASLLSELAAVGSAVEEAAGIVRARIDAAVEALARDRGVLAALHATQDQADEAVVARHDEDQGRVAERARLERRHLELSSTARRLAERRREHTALRDERARLLAELLARRQERFAMRERVARELSLGLHRELRLSIKQSGDGEAYGKLLADVLRGANVRPASLIADIAQALRPSDLAALVDKNDAVALAAVDDSKTQKIERAQRIIDVIRASGRLFELEIAELGDLPLIELRTGEIYKPSTQVSTGQRCTCILPIVLLRSAGPLIIDQPEDTLDNAFIYDVFVATILVAKKTRQFVFVTHNANIPVLGYAERVFAFSSDGARGGPFDVGTIDEVRGPAELILEGGRDAFLRRSSRYGHRAGEAVEGDERGELSDGDGEQHAE